MTIDVASQEQAFRNQMLQIPGAEIITEMVAESVRMGGSTYNPATRTVTVEGVRMRISSQGLRLPNS